MPEPSSQRVGTFYALSAFILWGLLPLYWRLLDAVPAHEILAHRTLWSFVFASAVLVARGKRAFLQMLVHAETRRTVVATGLLLGINWFTYIYSVNTGRVLQASIGYYINPLFSIFLGRVFLKERLSASQRIAVLFAACGVAVLTFGLGVVPWIALILMTTFGIYALIKKTVALEPLGALAVETLILTPPAAALILVGLLSGRGALASINLRTDILLLLTGIVTALPLYWFARAARSIPLARVGFIQYITPTLMFLIGVLLFDEPFTVVHAVSFSCIWTGIAVYLLSHSRPIRRLDARYAAFMDARTNRG